MFSLFKSVDKRLEEEGYNLIFESSLKAVYERYDDKFDFIHTVDIHREFNGEWILQSYNDTDMDVFLPVVPLTAYELNLFTKKMNQMRLFRYL